MPIQNIKSRPTKGPVPYCYNDGSIMVIRNSSDGSRFWGCTSYPECKYTIDISPDGEVDYAYHDQFSRD